MIIEDNTNEYVCGYVMVCAIVYVCVCVCVSEGVCGCNNCLYYMHVISRTMLLTIIIAVFTRRRIYVSNQCLFLNHFSYEL